MNYIKSFLVLFVLFLVSVASSAQSKVYSNEQHVAINGYDVVAYFNQNTAVRGSNEHTALVDGTTYYFSTAENASSFKAKPSAYQPVYGGFCAFAMAMKDAPVPSDPQTFKIRDGKLYLFFNDYYEGKPFNTIVPWNGNESALIDKANTNWEKM